PASLSSSRHGFRLSEPSGCAAWIAQADRPLSFRIENGSPAARQTLLHRSAGRCWSLLSTGEGGNPGSGCLRADVMEAEGTAVPCSPHCDTLFRETSSWFASLGRSRCETTRSA